MICHVIPCVRSAIEGAGIFEQLQINFVCIFQILDRYLVFLRMQKVLFGSMNTHTKFGVSVFFLRGGVIDKFSIILIFKIRCTEF